jgi:large subunit ribosomal protein L30
MAQKLRIKLVRSLVSRPKNQRAVVKALGLRKMHQTVIHENSPQINGMVRKVSHLLAVEEVDA